MQEDGITASMPIFYHRFPYNAPFENNVVIRRHIRWLRGTFSFLRTSSNHTTAVAMAYAAKISMLAYGPTVFA